MAALVHENLSREIIAAAMEVHSRLATGLDEKLYENAMIIELAKRNLRAEQQKHFPVYYDGHFIGRLIPDLIVNDLIILDLKVADALSPAHISQMLGYLAITELKLGILLNFKHASLTWKRIVREKS